MRYSLVRRARPVLPHPPLALWALHRTVPAVSTELGQVRHGSHRAREDITTSISSSQSPEDLLELWATHSDHMRNDIHLGNLWNKMGRFRKVIHNNRSFLSSRQRELKELLVETGAACSSQSFDARGLANIVHGAVKAGLLTYELGRDVHALCDEVGEALAPVIESQFHPQMAANSCWAFGAARHPHLRLFGAVSAALCSSPRSHPPAHLPPATPPTTSPPALSCQLAWRFSSSLDITLLPGDTGDFAPPEVSRLRSSFRGSICRCCVLAARSPAMRRAERGQRGG